MELAPAVYEEITGTSALPPVPGEDSDRRKHRRMPFGFRATIIPSRKGVEGPACVAMVRDISLAGISILNEDALKNGTSFVVEFKGAQDRPVKIRCNTVRCEQGGMGGTQYVIGATFEELLTKELPPLPKEEPLPPLSDQSRIHGRLIKPDSEFANHPATEADSISAHPGPIPSGPFTMVGKEEPVEPLCDQVHIYGKLIRPNSEIEKKPASAIPAFSPVAPPPMQPATMPSISDAKEEPADPIADHARIASRLAKSDADPTAKPSPLASTSESQSRPESTDKPSDPQSDQSRILSRLTKSDAEPEKKSPSARPAVPPAPAPAKDSTPPQALDEEAALALLLAEPDESLDGFTLDDFTLDEPETPSADDTDILEALAKSVAEAELKSAPEAKTDIPEEKPTAPKEETADQASDQARILSRLAKPEAEPEKKPAPAAATPIAPAAPVAPKVAPEPAAKPAPKPEAEKKTVAPASAVSAAPAEAAAKAPPKLQPATPASDSHAADRAAKPDTAKPAVQNPAIAKPAAEAEKKAAPASAAPLAHAVSSEPAKSAAKSEPAQPALDSAKAAEKPIKKNPDPETKSATKPIPAAASEDAAAQKPSPAIAKAQPAAPTPPAAPSWSIPSKPFVQGEPKPIQSLRSPAKGVKEMSLTHTEPTSEPSVAKHDVVAGVKSLLMQQREQLKKQEQEIQTLRTELAQAKRRAQQLQAKADADAKAMSELEAFLSKETGEAGPDAPESVAA